MTDKERKAVPREPTAEMIKAARHYFETPRIKAEIWRAMYDAAPVLATALAEPPKDGEAARLIKRLRELVADGREIPLDKQARTDRIKELESAVRDALARLSAPVPRQEAFSELRLLVNSPALSAMGRITDSGYERLRADVKRLLAAYDAAPVPAREWEIRFERLWQACIANGCRITLDRNNAECPVCHALRIDPRADEADPLPPPPAADK